MLNTACVCCCVSLLQVNCQGNYEDACFGIVLLFTRDAAAYFPHISLFYATNIFFHNSHSSSSQVAQLKAELDKAKEGRRQAQDEANGLR